MGIRGVLNGEIGSKIIVFLIDFFEGLDRIKRLFLIKKCKIIRVFCINRIVLGFWFYIKMFIYVYLDLDFCWLICGFLGGVELVGWLYC